MRLYCRVACNHARYLKTGTKNKKTQLFFSTALSDLGCNMDFVCSARRADSLLPSFHFYGHSLMLLSLLKPELCTLQAKGSAEIIPLQPLQRQGLLHNQALR